MFGCQLKLMVFGYSIVLLMLNESAPSIKDWLLFENHTRDTLIQKIQNPANRWHRHLWPDENLSVGQKDRGVPIKTQNSFDSKNRIRSLFQSFSREWESLFLFVFVLLNEIRTSH